MAEQQLQRQRVTFWITTSYYGGDIPLIEQAARDCGAQLVAVNGYDLADYPGEREYVEGNADYLFRIERDAPDPTEDARHLAWKTGIFGISQRVRVLAIEKYGE